MTMQTGSDLQNGSSLILVKYDTTTGVSAVFDLGINYKDFSLNNTSTGFTDAGRTALGNYLSWDLNSGNYASAFSKFDELTDAANVRWAVFAVDSLASTTNTQDGARGIIQTFNPIDSDTPPSINTSVLSTQLGAVNSYILGGNFGNDKVVSTFSVATASAPGAAVATNTAVGESNFLGLMVGEAIQGQGGLASGVYGETLNVYERLADDNLSPLSASTIDFFDNTSGFAKFKLTQSGLLSYSAPGGEIIAPTVVSITMADQALVAGETSLVTIVFSEAVTGFSNLDVTVANGTLSTLTSSNNITWTATFTPATNVNDTSNVITVGTVYTDLVGNAGTGLSSSNYSVITADIVSPTVVSITMADQALVAGETSLVTIVFSEAVTGFSNLDVTVANGTLSTLTSSNNITWTATFTPATNVNDTSNVITVGTVYTDLVGNAGTGLSSSNYSVITADVASPTVVSITMADQALVAGETSLVTIVFSEAVTGFSNADVTVANGSLSTLTSSNNITWTGTFTPATGINDTTNVITVATTSYTDVAGNAGAGLSSANYTMDTRVRSVGNDAPSVNPIANQSVNEGAAFNLDVLNNFSDVDAGDVLKLKATLADGKALPKWLKFNATTGVFSGTPSDADTATPSITIKVTATDKGKLFVADEFVLNIVAVNQAPTSKPITKAVTVTEGKAFTYNLAKGTFTDGDKADVLTYSASSKPDWLSIDSATGTLTTNSNFNYNAADSATTSVTIVARDGAGLTASTNLTVNLKNTPKISGTSNNDTIVAGNGDDAITGAAGNDTISGGAGIDRISGGAGNDTLTGGSGNDSFVFDFAVGAANVDTITDFASGDKLLFSKSIFKGLGKAAAPLTAEQFALSTDTLTAADRIIYNSTSGELFYDADGSGSVAAIKVALIGATVHPTLTFADMAII